MPRDIGRYFEKMTSKARGGRRLGTDGVEPPEREPPEREPPESAPEHAPRRTSGGGLGDMLKDALRKGRASATRTGRKAADTARDRIERTPKKQHPSRRTTRTSLPPEGVVTVEYSPRIDGDPDPGEVVWTWVPFEEDPEQGKDRPVVVIGRRNRNLVGVPLTTRQNDREAQIAIGTGDWDPERRPSYARIWRMLDIDESSTRREGAVLERGRFDDVIAAVDEYYDIRRSSNTSDDFDHDY